MGLCDGCYCSHRGDTQHRAQAPQRPFNARLPDRYQTSPRPPGRSSTGFLGRRFCGDRHQTGRFGRIASISQLRFHLRTPTQHQPHTPVLEPARYHIRCRPAVEPVPPDLEIPWRPAAAYLGTSHGNLLGRSRWRPVRSVTAGGWRRVLRHRARPRIGCRRFSRLNSFAHRRRTSVAQLCQV